MGTRSLPGGGSNLACRGERALIPSPGPGTSPRSSSAVPLRPSQEHGSTTSFRTSRGGGDNTGRRLRTSQRRSRSCGSRSRNCSALSRFALCPLARRSDDPGRHDRTARHGKHKVGALFSAAAARLARAWTPTTLRTLAQTAAKKSTIARHYYPCPPLQQSLRSSTYPESAKLRPNQGALHRPRRKSRRGTEPPQP